MTDTTIIDRSIKTTNTNIYEYMPQAVGGDGYDAMETAMHKGWHMLPGWGRDGWDAGNWPYVQFGWRAGHDGQWETYDYCEGDVTVKLFTSKEDATRYLDSVVHWHWRNSSEGPADPDLDNPDHCGPFSWSRLDDVRPD